MRKHKLLIAVITFGLTWIGIVRAEDQPIEQQFVDAMNRVFGVHPGFRANHAKGIVVEGSFKASPEAPVATGEDFRDLLLALAASPPDASKPTKFEQFAASHPSVPAAFATVGTPDSFADEEYYGVDAFVFVNKAGVRQAVRYQMMPERVVHLAAADAAKQSPNFLMDELPERSSAGQ